MTTYEIFNNRILDHAGFPLIWVEPINAFLGWLPTTKIQFEYFLCDSPKQRYDEKWYQMILELCKPVSDSHGPEERNDIRLRLSPTSVRKDNFYGLFITGIFPQEAIDFAEYCSDTKYQYRLPEADEWKSAYKYLRGFEPIPDPADFFQLRKRAYTVVNALDKISKALFLKNPNERTLADQMIMENGVMEWASNEVRGEIEWVGFGKAHGKLKGSLRGATEMEKPPKPEKNRIKHYGYRMLAQEG